MTAARTRLCVGYALLALLAVVATWRQNLRYLAVGGNPIEVNVRFWRDTFANPASTSVTVDLLLLVMAVFVWMLVEARRLEVRWPWAYLVGGVLVGISFTAPLFLIARERRLAARGEAGALGLGVADWAGLAVCSAISIGAALRSFVP